MTSRSTNPFSFPPDLLRLAPYYLRQVINPWVNAGTEQIGLVNIAQTATAKPEVETEIVQEVASYGRQLGRITELLALMLREPDPNRWVEDDKKVAEDFRRLAQEIAIVKARHMAPTDENVKKLVDGINSLRDVDQEEFERVRAEVRAKLFPEMQGAVAMAKPASSRAQLRQQQTR